MESFSELKLDNKHMLTFVNLYFNRYFFFKEWFQFI